MIRLDELVAQLGGELVGDPAVVIERIAPLEHAGPQDLAFLANPRYRSQLDACKAAAVILSPKLADATERPRILTPDPYLYFAQVTRLLNPARAARSGVHPSAVVVDPVPAAVEIGPHCSVEAGVELGAGVILGAGCSIGEGVSIGEGTRIYPNVTIYPGCRIGARCIIHAGAVIGADGFGFARRSDGSWLKIPQLGGVVIGDDVEIGANTTIDRGAIEDTEIGDGAILDNLVQIAHNVKVGRHTAMAGCAGVAGSVRIGERCMIGGGVGIAGHLEVADDVVVSAFTLISKSIRSRGVYTGGLPQQTHADWVKNFSHLRHLDALADRIRALEQRLEERSPDLEHAGYSSDS